MPNALEEKHIAFVGAGSMGGILIERLAKTGFPPAQILVVEPRSERRAELARQWGIAVSDDLSQAAECGDAIILAVPPPAVRRVLRELAPQLKPSHILLSLAVSVPLDALERLAGDGIPVVRVMPNSPSRVGQGMNPVAFGRSVAPDARAWVMQLLSRWGQTIEVPDAFMNLAVGLCAAAPTYIFAIMDALAEAGIAEGLWPCHARRIAAQVVFGSAALVLETGESVPGLRALTPFQPLREADANALFREAVECARAQMESLQTKLTGEA